MQDKLTPREILQGLALCLLMATGSLGGIGGSDSHIWTVGGMVLTALALLAFAEQKNEPPAVTTCKRFKGDYKNLHFHHITKGRRCQHV